MCDSIPSDLVVINPLENPRVVSRPRTVNDLFDVNPDGGYSVLECPQEPHRMTFPIKKCQTLHLYGLVNRITMVDFPMGQHILRANGMNLMTAHYQDGNYVFAIDSPNRSRMMDDMVAIARGRDEENVVNRSDYLNVERIDCLQILSTPHLEEDREILVEGIRREGREWVPFEISYTVYVKEAHTNPAGCIRDILFWSPKEEFQVSIRIYHQVFGPFQSHNKCVRLGFDGFSQWQGAQNQHLCAQNNRETINVSRVGGLGVITNTDELFYWEYAYKTYTLEGKDVFTR